MSNGVQILVLAAGIGKRMGNPDLPKVLIPLKGKPMLRYLLDAIKKSGVCDRPAIVVGKMADKVKQTFGDDYIYVLQKEQLGTGHAVLVSKQALKAAENIMVINGDHPLISSKLIKKLTDAHLSSGSVLTMATVTVPDYDDWRSEFKSFGKIIRTPAGDITAIVEVKDASPEQLEINELNPGYYCFKADWLWSNIDKLSPDNAQGEYYLTDLVELALGQNIQTISIDNPQEALGINTLEQLKNIEKLV